jgi:phospholipid/cholesterol/gamma-HCH transport system substrate-binding protein
MAELEIKPTVMMRVRVSIVILIALGLSGLLMYKLVGGSGDLLAPRSTLTTFMQDAAGISNDSEVRLSGIKIGKVRKIELSGSLDSRRAIRVEMRVLSRYLRDIPADSETGVKADTIVGNQFIDIAEGKSPVPIAENGVLPSEPVKQASDRADLIRTLQQNLAGIDQILIEISSGQTQIGQFVVGEEAYDTVLADIRGFDQAVHTFLTPRSDLGKAFYSPRLYDDLRGPALRIDRMLTSIQNGEGTAGHLFASDEQYNEILRALTGLRSTLTEANAGQGRYAALLHDDATYLRIARLLKATDAMIASLNAGEGQAGRLLASPQLYESLNGSLGGMEELLRDLREHPQKYLRYKLF